MKKHIEFFSRYIGFWMLMFVVMRLLFILFNTRISAAIPLSETALSFAHGLRLDLSTSAYLTVIPLLYWLVAQFAGGKWPAKVHAVYSIVMVSMVFIISLIDAELYAYWGQKLNAYASSFAKFPVEMFSFSSGISWSKLLLFVAVSVVIIKISYDNITVPFTLKPVHQKAWPVVLFFVTMGALLFLLIRGNLGMSPINQSFAYYSDKPFLNHAAVNTTWNFIASLADETEDETKNPYAFISDAEAQHITDSLLNNHATPILLQLSLQPKPDVVLIILEGWSADVVGFTGGEKDVAPNMTALAGNSLTYTQFYASGNRTDKGLAAILSGQPALAKSSIINKLQKFSDLPALPASLYKKGYNSTFVYGGESEFANMKAYWINSGYQHIADIHQFDKTVLPESWGMHDDELYTMLLKQIGKTASPKFITALTLSSHEPYKVPHQSRFKGTNEADRYRNAVHFADECLGRFLQEASLQSWYNNTLIVIMPDHAHQEPLGRSPFEPARFHIPFVVSGGALNPALKGVQIARPAQQTDFAPALLSQLGIDNQAFKWGNNMFDTSSSAFAIYTYNDGVGLVAKNGYAVYDHEAGRAILAKGNDSLAMTKAARAYQQTYYNDYLKR